MWTVAGSAAPPRSSVSATRSRRAGAEPTTQDREALHQLAALGAAGAVGVEAALLVPERLVAASSELARDPPPALGRLGLAEAVLQLRCQAQRPDEHPVGERALRPLLRALAVVPALRCPHQPVAAAAGEEGLDHPAHAGQQRAHEAGVVAPARVVVHGADPDEREPGDELRLTHRVSRLGQAGRVTRGVDQVERLARQAVVARHHVLDERLDAGVGDVLHLLEVGAVEVRLVRAHLHAAHEHAAGARRAPGPRP